MKGVFDTKPGSGYDDSFPERYHFRVSDYGERVLQCKGDWIIYRESRRNGGGIVYLGVARVVSVETDIQDPAFAYAHLDNFVQFDPPVPLTNGSGQYWEAPLRALEKRLVGAFLQRKNSVRLMSDADFGAIVGVGLRDTLLEHNIARYAAEPDAFDARELDGEETDGVFVRRIVQVLQNRPVRDANFRRLVCHAYNDTCAVTGLRIINGRGRSEAQAAHIWGVDKGGPDFVRNGIALSGTVHWLFDRHLISFTTEYELLVASDGIPTELRSMFASQGNRLRLPADKGDWPHPKYIKLHSDAFARKGAGRAKS